MTGSEVRYVNSGGVHIAYRVFGDGPVDLVLVPAFTSHLEQNHEWPGVVRWNARLVSFSRLIVFDKRSTGLSDHAPGPVVLEDTMQDVLAVMDAAGAERPAVIGDLEGAALSALFAATHPERTEPWSCTRPWSRAPPPTTSPGRWRPSYNTCSASSYRLLGGVSPWPGCWRALWRPA